MHPGLIGCDATAPLDTVAWILADENIHALLVHRAGGRDRSAADRWGLITASELLRALADGRRGLTAASMLANSSYVTVAPTDRLHCVVRLMAGHALTHVLVMEHASPVGVVSALDVARAIGGARARDTP